MRTLRGERGQALVELVALAPVLVAAVAGLVIGLAGAAEIIAAEHALDRALVAKAAGGDVEAAAREALGPRLAGRVHITDGRRVTLAVDLVGPLPVVRIRGALEANP